jgi:hypothetical protein
MLLLFNDCSLAATSCCLTLIQCSYQLPVTLRPSCVFACMTRWCASQQWRDEASASRHDLILSQGKPRPSHTWRHVHGCASMDRAP